MRFHGRGFGEVSCANLSDLIWHDLELEPRERFELALRNAQPF